MNIKLFLNNKVLLNRKNVYKVFLKLSGSPSGFLFTYFNQNSFNIFYSNEKYRELLNQFYVYQEGIGLYLALKILDLHDVERIDSTEVHKKFFNFIISNYKSIAFIGGKFDEQELINRARKFGLEIEFYHNGFFDDGRINYLIKNLQNIKSKFVVIGMGSPKQEFLASELFKNLPDKKIVCVGNFMNYFLGYQRRAPELFRRFQIEWFYRFLQEPFRLFNRYFIGIPLFIWRIFKLKLNNNKLPNR